MSDLYTYKAQVVRVVDGDTVDLLIDLGLRVSRQERCRLYGIDAPETYGVKKGSEEYQNGMQTKARLIELVEGRTLFIETIKDKQGKYGRYLVKLYVPCGDVDDQAMFPSAGYSVNDLLVEEGLAEYRDY